MISEIYKNLDLNVAEFLINLAKTKNPPIYTLSYEKAREELRNLQKNSYNTIPVQVKKLDIPYEKNKSVSVTIIRPEHSDKPLPVALYFHGGGWILGDELTHDRLIRQIANKANIAIAFVNYTPSPEAHYTTIIEEGYGALTYIASHGKELQLDTKHLAVVGDSAGGTLAATITLLAKERKGPKIDCQVLFYPVTNADFNTQSYQQFAHDFWLTKEAMEWFWNAYAPDIQTRNNYIVAPLHAPVTQLQGLPPTLIINAEIDVLRDDGVNYARKLFQAGVNTVHVQYLGTIHDFVMLDPLKNAAATKNAIDLASNTLKNILHSVHSNF